MSDETTTPVAEPEATQDAPAFNPSYDRDALLVNLPEGYDKDKFSKYLEKTADPYVAFKNYSNLEKMKGKGLPNEAWEDEDYANLYRAMGVPEDPDGYQFGESVQLDDDSAKFVKGLAAQMKLTPDKAEMLAGTLQQIRQTEEQKKAEELDQKTENMVSYLSSEWGHPDSSAYQNNFKLVSGVLESIGIKDGTPESDAIWSGPPQIVSLLKEYADMLDPKVVQSWGVGDTTTVRSIEEQMSALSAAMYRPGMDFTSKEFKEMEAKYDRLHAQRSRM